MPHSYRLLLILPTIITASALAVPPAEQNSGPTQPLPEEALTLIQVEKGLQVRVWAMEPLLANPVSFAFDGKGRCFIAETTRFENGVPDTRAHMHWRDDDLALRTVGERLAMYKKAYPGQKPYAGFEAFPDQLRMVWDSTGSGRADKSTVFAGSFNRPEDGLAAGVLARKGDVYFACVPNLYLLKDTKGANKADVKEILSSGYGVKVQFLGHDLHGLRMGPDGKLYFTMGDRGLNVSKDGKHLVNIDSGSVLRCDPDGGNLEVVHTGLRNPQELAFDDYGNLFTFDNNSDVGDKARWVYVVEGADSGWRNGYQYGTAYHTPEVPEGNRGPWNTEKLWHLPFENQAAYVLPPIAHFGNGPSGMTHYPGIGLSDRYKNHFFCTDFTSTPNNSVIWSLGVKPKGAGFEIEDLHPFVRGMLPTDCEFGPDGAFYWSDWVGGWKPPGKGRIFQLTDPAAMKNPAVAEAKALLAEGFDKKSNEQLLKLLEFPHQQVRQEAQFELASRGLEDKVIESLRTVAAKSKNTIARLHAMWALGMIGSVIGRNSDVVPPYIAALMSDPDAEIRAQAAKVLGWLPVRRNNDLSEVVSKALSDPSPRVKFFAVQTYGKIKKVQRAWAPKAAEGEQPSLVLPQDNRAKIDYFPVLDLLRANNDKDVYLRNVAVAALVNMTTDPMTLVKSGFDEDGPAVRLGRLLALRRIDPLSISLSPYLTDKDPRIVVEAARAIHDDRITRDMGKLADLVDRQGLPDAVAYRALSACFKMASPEYAVKIARFAARASEPEHTRLFALKLLADWAEPPRRDHITGLSVELEKRPEIWAAIALKAAGMGLFTGSDAVRRAAAQLIGKLGVKEYGPPLAALVKDAAQPASTRAESLQALSLLGDPMLGEITALALASPEPKLRAAARLVKARSDSATVLSELPALLIDKTVTVIEKQGAFAILASLKESEKADQLLAEWLDLVLGGQAAPELVLDILDAADARIAQKFKLHAALKAKLDSYRSAQAAKAHALKGDTLAPWAEALVGGDADKGRSIFLSNNAVYCQRCHKLDGQGGEVGPQLNGIAAEAGKDRRYLLESVVYPNARIAKGYETVVLTLTDGRVVSGVLKSEDKKQLRLMTAEAKELIVPVDDIEGRRTGPSAMPDDLYKKLSHRELRDLVEFLGSLKEPIKK